MNTTGLFVYLLFLVAMIIPGYMFFTPGIPETLTEALSIGIICLLFVAGALIIRSKDAASTGNAADDAEQQESVLILLVVAGLIACLPPLMGEIRYKILSYAGSFVDIIVLALWAMAVIKILSGLVRTILGAFRRS